MIQNSVKISYDHIEFLFNINYDQRTKNIRIHQDTSKRNSIQLNTTKKQLCLTLAMTPWLTLNWNITALTKSLKSSVCLDRKCNNWLAYIMDKQYWNRYELRDLVKAVMFQLSVSQGVMARVRYSCFFGVFSCILLSFDVSWCILIFFVLWS